MAQFIPIGGGAQLQPRVVVSGNRGPSAAEMLALMMQSDRNQNRLSAAEALALILPIMQGAMGQQNFAAQLAAQQSQFGERLGFEREQSEREYDLLAKKLGFDTAQQSNQFALMMKQLEQSGEAQAQQGQMNAAQIEAIRASIEQANQQNKLIQQDRQAALTTVAAENIINDVMVSGDVKRQTIENAEAERELEHSAAAMDHAMSLATQMEAESGGSFLHGQPLMTQWFGGGADKVLDTLLKNIEAGEQVFTYSRVGEPIPADPGLDQYGYLQTLEHLMGDPGAVSNLSRDAKQKATRFLASPIAARIRQDERQRQKDYRQSLVKVGQDTRKATQGVKERARSAQREIYDEIAPLLSNIQMVNGLPVFTMTDLPVPAEFE